MNFNNQIYSLLKKVPKGKITTYKHLAEAAGTKAYQAVGNAMNKNPYWPKVPCHRVVKADGTVGRFAQGTKKKIALLKKEGLVIENNKIKNFKSKLFKFKK